MKKIIFLLVIAFIFSVHGTKAQNVVFDETTQTLSTELIVTAGDSFVPKELFDSCERALDTGREILKEFVKKNDLGIKFYGCWYEIIDVQTENIQTETENRTILLKLKIQTKYYVTEKK